MPAWSNRSRATIDPVRPDDAGGSPARPPRPDDANGIRVSRIRTGQRDSRVGRRIRHDRYRGRFERNVIHDYETLPYVSVTIITCGKIERLYLRCTVYRLFGFSYVEIRA
jgi:hypothetical protein